MSTAATSAHLGFSDFGTCLLWSAASPFGVAAAPASEEVVVTVDPAFPDRMISLCVADPVAALDTVARLIGEDGRQSFEEALAQIPDGDPIVVSATPNRRLAPFCRLALAMWNERWTPLDISEVDALLDVGTAAHAAGQVEVAAEAFNDAVLTRLLDLVRDSRDEVLPQVIRQTLRDTVSAAIETLGSAHRHHRALQDRLEILEPPITLDELPEVAFNLRDRELGWLTATAPAAWKGELRGPSAFHAAGVDWRQVPPRVVATDEFAVSWETSGEAVKIVVQKHPQLDPESSVAECLLVRIVDRVTGQPLAGDFLTLDREAGVFRSQIAANRIGPAGPDGFTVDVYAVDAIDDAAVGGPEVVARAWRESVRSLAYFRLAAAANLVGGQLTELADLARESAGEAEYLLANELHVDNEDEEIRSARQATAAWAAGLDREDAAAPGAALGSGVQAVGVPVPGAEDARRPLLSELLLLRSRGLIWVPSQPHSTK